MPLHRRAGLGGRGGGFVLVLGVCGVVEVGGQRRRPKRLEAAGFTFRWYDLE
ncbi:DUF1731 domain-containing protein, partial [Enterobacter hormaechei]